MENETIGAPIDLVNRKSPEKDEPKSKLKLMWESAKEHPIIPSIILLGFGLFVVGSVVVQDVMFSKLLTPVGASIFIGGLFALYMMATTKEITEKIYMEFKAQNNVLNIQNDLLEKNGEHICNSGVMITTAINDLSTELKTPMNKMATAQSSMAEYIGDLKTAIDDLSTELKTPMNKMATAQSSMAEYIGDLKTALKDHMDKTDTIQMKMAEDMSKIAEAISSLSGETKKINTRLDKIEPKE